MCIIFYFLHRKKTQIKLTCLLLTVVVVFVALTDVIFEVSVFVIPPPPAHGAVDLNAEDTLEADWAVVEAEVMVCVMFVTALEFVDAVVSPTVVVGVEWTADELAMRSESLSDKSELLEELSLMSQWPLDPVLIMKKKQNVSFI